MTSIAFTQRSTLDVTGRADFLESKARPEANTSSTLIFLSIIP